MGLLYAAIFVVAGLAVINGIAKFEASLFAGGLVALLAINKLMEG